ncbi:MAG: hypothetical protein QOG66_3390 [Methylobacteriaceae bacterium]|jgi:hypothetical protein|nr:hypothetical protein [Methylobacteriaceae bacterium]
MEHDNRDVKELVGLLMRALDGQALTRAAVMDCAFEAEGELLEALNDAYIKLLQHAHDCEAQETDRLSEASERHRELQASLDRIILLYESAPPISNRSAAPSVVQKHG